mgnify:CR=1 FL=1
MRLLKTGCALIALGPVVYYASKPFRTVGAGAP